jgi:hypothetical protein
MKNEVIINIKTKGVAEMKKKVDALSVSLDRFF